MMELLKLFVKMTDSGQWESLKPTLLLKGNFFFSIFLRGSTEKFHATWQPVLSYFNKTLAAASIVRNILFNRIVSSCISEVSLCISVLHVKGCHLVGRTNLAWGMRGWGGGSNFCFVFVLPLFVCLLVCQTKMKNWTWLYSHMMYTYVVMSQ